MLFTSLISCAKKKQEVIQAPDITDQNYSTAQIVFSRDSLINKSLDDLRIIRNEIFARHGYIFKSRDLRNYFSKMDWYDPKYENVDSLLTEVDKKNIALIISIEHQLKPNSFKDRIVGQWLNQEYYSALISSKSPRFSQEKAGLVLIEFTPNFESFIVYNWHEGINPNYFIQNDTLRFERFENSYAILINNNTLELNFGNDHGTYLKYESIDSSHKNLAINKLIFAGEYINTKNGRRIKFNGNGIVSGLENFMNYRVRDDYYDQGLDVDLIDFTTTGNSQQLTWDFSQDTLFLYKIKCAKYDSVNNSCDEIAKGAIKYKLLKLN